MKSSEPAFSRLQLWPLFLLLAAELAALAFFAGQPAQNLAAILTPFSALVAALILLSGLLPALLRPHFFIFLRPGAAVCPRKFRSIHAAPVSPAIRQGYYSPRNMHQPVARRWLRLCRRRRPGWRLSGSHLET